MSAKEDDYSFLNNVDQKILIAMIFLVSFLTLGAIWMNIAVRKDVECTPQLYTYCGEKAPHGHHGDEPH